MRFTGETYLDEALGSDAFHVLSQRADGWRCLPLWRCKMQEQAKRLRKVKPHYTHFRIMRGSILRATPVSDLIEIQKNSNDYESESI